METLLPFLSAFTLTILAIPPTIWLAKKFGLVDDPNSRPHPAHIHTKIIPRAGGLAMFISLVSSILLFVPLEKYVIGILLSITVLLLMGLLDDKLKSFNPYIRLLFQFLAAAIVVASGVGITFITNPLGGIIRLDEIVIPFQILGQHSIVLIADLFAFFWIVAVMNTVNWSKGVDGQMPGIVFIAALTIGSVALNFYNQGDPNQFTIALLSFITAGVSLGFLLFNWYPAKIFPGFSGSTILGFMIATLSILTSAKIATALLVLLIPIVDSIYLFISRISSGRSPVWADKNHLHHRLLSLGWSHQRISLFYISSCAILGLLATTLSSQEKFLTALIVGLSTLGIIVWMHFLFVKPKQQNQPTDQGLN